ncbi:MAG: helix-turn-helix transcriptional regulator [bacterium]
MNFSPSFSDLFRQTVRRVRLEKGLSQERLAVLAGLDRTYLSGFERGTRNISLVSLGKIINGLGLEPTEFLAVVRDEKG